jgi:Na+-transporting methylmalonyl-CoA/oxaloacetate decarboxylase gamma subunit
MFLESFGLVALGAAFVLVLVILRERMTGFSAQRSEHYAQPRARRLISSGI